MESRYRGHIDGLVDGHLQGWIVDMERPSESTPVSIESDCGHVEIVRPTYGRRDVASSHGALGVHGFSLPIGLLAGNRFCARDPAGQRLANGEFELPLADDLGARDETPVRAPSDFVHVYLHIQKTAGTSVIQSIRPSFAQSEVALIYPEPHHLSLRQFAQIPFRQKQYFRLVAGHTFFGVHKYIGKKFRYTTLLRDPIERVISHFWHKWQWSRFVQIGDARLPLWLAVNEGLLDEFDNLQIREIAGLAIQELPLGEIANSEFELARYNVSEYFGWVGFQDSLEHDIAALREYLGIGPGEVQRLNVREVVETAAGMDDFNRIDWDRVRRRHEPEIALYQELKSAKQA